MKKLGTALILLGGAGLLLIKVNTPVWYLAILPVLIGFIVMTRGENDKKDH